MKKLFIFLFCLIGLAASAQQATPVSPVQVPQATLYNEPSTGTRWWYNGATLGWYPVFPYSPPNTVLTGLSLSVVSSTLTVHTGTWRINNQVYTLASNTNFTLQARDSLYSRYETVYATGANNGIGIKVGILSPTPIQPSVGTDTLIVGAVLITPTQTTIIPPGPANEFVFSGPLVQQSYANPWVRTLRVDTIKVAGQYIMPSRHGTSGQFIQDDGNGNLFFSNAGTYLPGFGLLLTGQTFSADTNKLVTQTALLDTLRNNAAHFNPTQFTIVNDTISLIGGGGGNTIYTGDGTISDPLGRMVTISNSSILQFATPKLSGDSVYVGIDNTGFYAYRHSTNGGTTNLDDEIYAGIGNTALLSTDNTTGNNSTVTTASGDGTGAEMASQNAVNGNTSTVSTFINGFSHSSNVIIEAFNGTLGAAKQIGMNSGDVIGEEPGIYIINHVDSTGMHYSDAATVAKIGTDTLQIPHIGWVERYVADHATTTVTTGNGISGDGSSGTPVILGGNLTAATTINAGTQDFQMQSASGLNVASLRMFNGTLTGSVSRSSHGSATLSMSISGSDPQAGLNYTDNAGTGVKGVSVGIGHIGIYTTDSKSSLGYLYAGDYGTNQRANRESVPSVRTVIALADSVKGTITGGLTGATNGLSVSGSNAVLGGAQTGDITISNQTHDLYMGDDVGDGAYIETNNASTGRNILQVGFSADKTVISQSNGDIKFDLYKASNSRHKGIEIINNDLSGIIVTDNSKIGLFGAQRFNVTSGFQYLQKFAVDSTAIAKADSIKGTITGYVPYSGATGNVNLGSNFITAGASLTPQAAIHAISTISTTPRGILSDQNSADAVGARITMRKSRGTPASPTVITTGDVLGSWTAAGYTNAYTDAAKVLVTSTGTISNGVVPSIMELQTMTTGGTLTDGIKIDQAQALTFGAYGTGLLHSGSAGAITSSAVNLAGSDVTGILPNANTTATAANTASAIVARDANNNAAINNLTEGYTTTATAAGTTTLTVSSAPLQYFTGSTTQTVVLPVTSTLVLGQQFTIVNNSTGIVTVQSSGANVIFAQPGSTTVTYTVILTSGTTTASWAANYTLGVSSLGSAANINLQVSPTGLVNYASGGTTGFRSRTASSLDMVINNNSYAVFASNFWTFKSNTLFDWSSGDPTSAGGDVGLGRSGVGVMDVTDGAATGAGHFGNLRANNITVGLGAELKVTEGTGGFAGQTTLVAGTKAITITGVTTSSRAFCQLVSQGGTVTTTQVYAAVCTANTLTITALTNAGSTDTTDTSVLNYFIVN